MKHGKAVLKWHLYVVSHLFTFPVTALTLCWHSVAPYNLIQFTCPADSQKEEDVVVLQQHVGLALGNAGEVLGPVPEEE